MARTHVYKSIQDAEGAFLAGCTIRALELTTTDLLTDALYTTENGSDTLTNPFVSDSGLIEFWLDTAKRFRLGITPPGGTEFFITRDTEVKASEVVVSVSPLKVINAAVPGLILVAGNNPGEAAWGTFVNTQQVQIEAPNGGVWLLSVDNDGHLVTTLQP